jgi:vacuolar-type H+-ATPase subunit H
VSSPAICCTCLTQYCAFQANKAGNALDDAKSSAQKQANKAGDALKHAKDSVLGEADKQVNKAKN